MCDEGEDIDGQRCVYQPLPDSLDSNSDHLAFYSSLESCFPLFLLSFGTIGMYKTSHFIPLYFDMFIDPDMNQVGPKFLRYIPDHPDRNTDLISWLRCLSSVVLGSIEVGIYEGSCNSHCPRV